MTSCCSREIKPKQPGSASCPSAAHIASMRYVALIIHGFLLVWELQAFYKKAWGGGVEARFYLMERR
jgi:hypothetical protein